MNEQTPEDVQNFIKIFRKWGIKHFGGQAFMAGRIGQGTSPCPTIFGKSIKITAPSRSIGKLLPHDLIGGLLIKYIIRKERIVE